MVLEAVICYLLLALAAGPMLELMDRNRNVHAMPVLELLKFPVDRWLANLKRLTGWWLGYQGGLLFALASVGIVAPAASWRARAFVLALVLLPLAFFTIFGGVLFSRYMLIGTPFLCLMAGVGTSGLSALLQRRWAQSSIPGAAVAGTMVLVALGGTIRWRPDRRPRRSLHQTGNT